MARVLSELKLSAEDVANLNCIQSKIPNKKIIYFCSQTEVKFSQSAFENALKAEGVPFKHYEYIEDKPVLNSSNGEVNPDDPEKPIIYFGKNIKFSNRMDSVNFPGQKSPFALSGYVINCDIIICGSELASPNSVFKNKIYGKCILYKPIAQRASVFSTNLINEGLYVVGDASSEIPLRSKPISSGRADFSTKHIRYLYGDGLMTDIFKNLEEPFAAEPTLSEILDFVISEPDSESKTQKSLKSGKKIPYQSQMSFPMQYLGTRAQ